ncbi:MAG: adenylate/guanylate cyclase domain-containing protein [Solirubrobacterales bacterium]
MQQPKTRYAKNGDVNIAYQVVGDGPLDLVFVFGYLSHLDLIWSTPESAAFFRRLASFSRLILFDKRGTGLSDPVSGVPSLEERMEDLRAVLDAAGSQRTALFGWSEGGPIGILFAAAYPERIPAMAIYGSTPRFTSSKSFLPEKREAFERTWGAVESAIAVWGEGKTSEAFAPNFADDAGARRTIGLLERASVSPAMAEDLLEAARKIDVLSVLPTIDVPTLVLHHSGDLALPVEAARYMAERIPDARLVELPGDYHIPWLGDHSPLLDEVERFLTGARQSRDPDRVLATVLFTDIVGSTEKASELGDRRWRELLEAHDTGARRQVETHGGRVVKGLGDGHLATFDGPARAIRCARTLVEDAGSLGLEVRAGVHTGECELLEGDDMGGMAVHIGARVAAIAAPGEVLVSRAVRDLVVGSGIDFEERGAHELKGVPGSWDLLAVAAAGAGESRRETFRAGRPDRLAPNMGVSRRGDRFALRVARDAPALARLASRLTLWRSNRKMRAERRTSREG